MNKTIEIGKINHLKVERDTDYGLFLVAQNFEEVLLPNAYVIEDEMPIGSIVEVFIYTDSEDRIVATTKYPYAMLGEFGYFTVVDYQRYGAFVNWGLPKDLFVPLSQQKCHFNIGKKFSTHNEVYKHIVTQKYIKLWFADISAIIYTPSFSKSKLPIFILKPSLFSILYYVK